MTASGRLAGVQAARTAAARTRTRVSGRNERAFRSLSAIGCSHAGMEEAGPEVNLLSAKQLRFVARIRALRPAADFHWHEGRACWSLDVVEHGTDDRCRSLLKARLGADGTIRNVRSWL